MISFILYLYIKIFIPALHHIRIKIFHNLLLLFIDKLCLSAVSVPDNGDDGGGDDDDELLGRPNWDFDMSLAVLMVAAAVPAIRNYWRFVLAHFRSSTEFFEFVVDDKRITAEIRQFVCFEPIQVTQNYLHLLWLWDL